MLFVAIGIFISLVSAGSIAIGNLSPRTIAGLGIGIMMIIFGMFVAKREK